MGRMGGPNYPIARISDKEVASLGGAFDKELGGAEHEPIRNEPNRD